MKINITKFKYSYLPIIFLLIVVSSEQVFSYEVCDSSRFRRPCPGNSLLFSVTSGKGAHYVDIDNTPSRDNFGEQLTVEMWMKLDRLPNRLQFVAGLWGPAEDVNDVWAIYFSPDDKLVFELNGNNTNLRQNDNTIVQIGADTLYNKWFHLSAVFDGRRQMAYIYIDGILQDSSRNASYPLGQLRRLQNAELRTQIGSTNALTNNRNYRTFKGQMDEIRIWARALQAGEILCQKDVALIGTEDSLMVYYRCNEYSNIYNLCDASGHGNFGRARSGTRTTSDTPRPYKQTTTVFPMSINDTIQCSTTKRYTFTITDVGLCQTGAYNDVRIWPRDPVKEGYFTSYPVTMYFDPNVPTTFDVEINADFVGTINMTLIVRRLPWASSFCGYSIANIPFKITRVTELKYSTMGVEMGLLKAHCQEQLYTDSVITICNNTRAVGAPKDIVINGLATNMPDVFEPIAPSGFPIRLAPDECVDITVRFKSGDSSAIYYDTLKVLSTDECAGSGVIPLTGQVQEVLGLFSEDSESRVDSIDFGTVCRFFASDPYNYVWANMSEEDIWVDTIIVPEHFQSRSFRFPVRLEPETGYRPNYFRFTPTAQGIFNDSIIFVVRANGCTIRKPVYVTGKGYVAEVEFLSDSVDFGDVIVGQENTLNIGIRNNGIDTVRMAFSLYIGDGFIFPGARAISIPPNQTRYVPVTFRPSHDSVYIDRLCLAELRCWEVNCIPIRGRGIIERFEYDPVLMRTANVIGCSSQLDTLFIKNISGSPETLSDFVFDNPSGRYSLVDPQPLPSSLALNDGQSARFIFRYTPNDVTQDRADRAYLRYKTSDDEDWAAQLIGTSITPKFYLTDLTQYGKIEVGSSKRDTLLIENISSLPITVDSITVTNGFLLAYPQGFLGFTLNPRDTIKVIVDFLPVTDLFYSGTITVYSESPCAVRKEGTLEGRGIIIPLELSLTAISFGFVRPCDCYSRELPLVNRSYNFPMTVDSVWIDSVGVIDATPELFTWSSDFSPDGTLPYDIPPRQVDTLRVVYCPRSPAERRYIDNNSNIKILASGSGWQNLYTTFLAGKRMLIMQPWPIYVGFPPTRVDTFSTPGYVNLYIPEADVNPGRSGLRIDSVTFDPPERVFTASDSLGRIFPIAIDSNLYLPLRIDFKPRSVRTYNAKMNVHLSSPCITIDTTVFITGSGFAPAFGLSFNYDNEMAEIDTFRVIGCDTLEVPVYSSRQIPADLVDIRCRIGYDTTKLDYVDSRSPYTDEPCPPYVPDITESYSPFGGSEFLMKNFCYVDSTRPFLIARFVPRSMARDTFRITVDSIFFDTEEVILYHIIAAGDEGIVIIQQPDFEILNAADFDSVRVLDCSNRDILIRNIGDLPLAISSIFNLPPDIAILNSSPPMGSYLQPGDTAVVTIRFCPYRKQTISQLIGAESIDPCALSDSTAVDGTGFVPELSFFVDISSNFSVTDTISATLGDTIIVPVMFEKDFSTVYNNITYWLNGLRFNTNLRYNARALKYLGAEPTIDAEMGVDYTHGSLNLGFSNVDTLRAGEIATVEFLMTVPDSIMSSIFISSADFDTDSIFFMEPIPIASDAVLFTGAKCNLQYVKYSDKTPQLGQNTPNPWNTTTTIEFTSQEKAGLLLEIYSITGEKVMVVLDGTVAYPPGTYTLDINSIELESGVYFYVLQAGTYKAIKSMILTK